MDYCLMGERMERKLFYILLLVALGITGAVNTMANWNIEVSGEGLLDVYSNTGSPIRYGDYIIIPTDDLLVMDISDPIHPEHVSIISELDVSDIYALVNDLLYIRIRSHETSSYELFVYDISDIVNPVLLGSNPDHGDWLYATVGNGYLFTSIRDENICTIYDTQNSPLDPEAVASITVDDEVIAITCDRDILAIQTHDGIIFYSIVDPLHPEYLSTIIMYIQSLNETMVFNDTIIYFLNIDHFYTIDFSDPTNPEIILDQYLGHPAVTFAMAGDFIVITTPVYDTQIIDISTPLEPQFVSTLPVLKYYPFAVSDTPSLFYVFRGKDTWIDIVEASPEPHVVDSIDHDGWILNMSAYNDVAYSRRVMGNDQRTGMFISDYRESNTPEEILLFQNKVLYDVITMNNYLITHEKEINEITTSIGIYDVNNPYEPVELSRINVDHLAEMRLTDHYLFVDHTPLVYNIEDPENPIRLYGIRNEDLYQIEGTTVIERKAGEWNRLIRYRLDNGLTALDTTYCTGISELLLDDDLLIVKDENNTTLFLKMIDLSHPIKMIQGPELQISLEGRLSNLRDYKLSDDHLYLLFDSGLLQVYEVANGLADPVLAGEYDLNPNGLDISICGTKAYAISSNNVYQLDLSELLEFNAQPDIAIRLQVLNSPPVIPPSGGDIEFNAYVTNSLENSQLVQGWITITAPDNSTLTGSPINFTLQPGELAGRNGISLNVPPESESGLYTVTANLGVYPDQVVAEANFQFYKSAGQLSVSFASGLIEWAIIGWSFDDDVEHLRQSTISGDYIAAPDPVLPDEFALNAYPNPFNERATISLSLPETGEVRVQVYDVTGRLVTTLRDGVLNAGVHRLEWDATGQASGVYFLSVTHTDGEQTVRKLALVR
jgi:hypothetical protein